jgi:hypothetical protein
MGLSMGATHAYWLAALDERVAAVAHLCAFADMAPLIASGAHDLHGIYMSVPGLLAKGDMGDVAALIAPRPQFIAWGGRDPLTPEAAISPALSRVTAPIAQAGAENALWIVPTPRPATRRRRPCAPKSWLSWPGLGPGARCGRHRPRARRIDPALDPVRGPCHQVRMWRFAILFLLTFAVLPRPVAAQEFIAVPDLISDEAFYRLVACAAPPGGECAKPFIRWPTERRLRLRVGIAQIAEEFAGYRLDLVDRSVDRAIAEINGAGAHLYLERAFEGPFDVPIYLVDAPQGGEIAGTGVADLDGSSISIGRVALRSRGDEITGAAIAISGDIQRREIASVVLEELVQAMGLVTDVVSPAYSGSIFSENDNSATRFAVRTPPRSAATTRASERTSPAARALAKGPPPCSIPRPFRTTSARSRTSRMKASCSAM